jgi:hypothetical protein
MSPFQASVLSIEVGVRDHETAQRIIRDMMGEDTPEAGKGKEILDGVKLAYLRVFEPDSPTSAATMWVDFSVQHKGAIPVGTIGRWLCDKLQPHGDGIRLRIDTQDISATEEEILKATADAVEGHSLD